MKAESLYEFIFLKFLKKIKSDRGSPIPSRARLRDSNLFDWDWTLYLEWKSESIFFSP